MRWLEALPRSGCLFAVAPDVYPDAPATLVRSRPYLGIIREMGFPAAFVGQNGAEDLDLPWDEFDCLFIGGERTPNPLFEWKVSRSAERLVRVARDRGKWVHMGRVNSLGRMKRAREMGCHSADGTFLKYRRRKMPDDTKWSRQARGASELEGWINSLDTTPLPPPLEGASLPIHREAEAAMDLRRQTQGWPQ